MFISKIIPIVVVQILHIELCYSIFNTSQKPINNQLRLPTNSSSLNKINNISAHVEEQNPRVNQSKGLMIDRTTHESFSPSSLSSFYNYINQKNAKQSNQPNDQLNLNPKNQISSRQHSSTPAVALGREYDVYNKPQTASSEYIETPMLLPSGNNFAAIGTVLDQQLYADQGMMPPIGHNSGQEQILNQFYTNGMSGNQHNNPKLLERGQTYQTLKHNTYNPQQPVHDQSLSLMILEDPLTGNKYYGNEQQLNPSASRFTAGLSPDKATSEKHKSKKKMLTNDQLASLIDELKEFNSKQASKIQNDILPEHPTKQSEVRDIELPEAKKEEDNLVRSASKNNPDNTDESDENKNKDDSKANFDTEDLAKFAKFLMTKEGSNLKFQLGLDKDAPDDGDEEDDRDALLESKKKPTKTRPKKKSLIELEDLDRKHSEVEAQMDKLITDMSGKVKKAGRITKRKRKDDDDLNDRKKRDYSSIPNKNKTKEVSKGMVIINRNSNKPNFSISKDQDENFAKMLIQKELMEDKSDSKTDMPNKISVGNTSGNKRMKKLKRSNSFQMEPSSMKAMQSDGDNNYPKLERNKDQIALLHELQKTRRKKSKVRSRLPIAENSGLKNGLTGEIQTELHPDGTLSLKAHDDVLTLKLPKKRNHLIETKQETSDLQSPDYGHQVDSVKIQSATPLQDEYPISERVSDRLNKLSNNLDRYFNDGFLQEIGAKSRIDGIDSSEKDPRQSSTSNIQESQEKLEKIHKPSEERLKVDHDFDVNVSIDGKRDPDSDPDEEPDQEKGNEKESEDGDEVNKKKRSKARVKSSKTMGNKGKAVNRNKKNGRVNDDSSSLKRRLGQNEELKKAPEYEKKSKHLRRDESSRKEKIEFENSGSLLPNLDPVESESLDTPIGPDSDDADADLSNAKKVKSSEESNVSTRYGKKVGGKFYEEPQWK